jgi:hypothetical protein
LPLADRNSLEIGWPQRPAAGLALNGEHGAEASVTSRAVRPELVAALRANGRQLVLGLVEIPLRETAAEADGGPVSEDLPALLPYPVGCLAHEPTVAPEMGAGDGQSSG